MHIPAQIRPWTSELPGKPGHCIFLALAPKSLNLLHSRRDLGSSQVERALHVEAPWLAAWIRKGLTWRKGSGAQPSSLQVARVSICWAAVPVEHHRALGVSCAELGTGLLQKGVEELFLYIVLDISKAWFIKDQFHIPV